MLGPGVLSPACKHRVTTLRWALVHFPLACKHRATTLDREVYFSAAPTLLESSTVPIVYWYLTRLILSEGASFRYCLHIGHRASPTHPFANLLVILLLTSTNPSYIYFSSCAAWRCAMLALADEAAIGVPMFYSSIT